MWLGLLALMVGLLVGLVMGASWSDVMPAYSDYVGIALLAGIDSVLGGLRAGLERHFDHHIFLSGFFANSLLAVLMVLMGDLIGVDLILAAIVAFGVRMFNNLAVIRRLMLASLAERWNQAKRRAEQRA